MELTRIAAKVADREHGYTPEFDPTAPTDREWKERQEASTISASEWKRYTRN